MKLAIVGSRKFNDLFAVEAYLNREAFSEVITGGAEGVDKRAEEWCKRVGTPCEVIRPIDNKPISYLFRNVEIITRADKVIAFWDGKSKGTKFVIDYCKARHKPLEIIRVD